MVYENYHDAFDAIQPFEILKDVFYEPLEKQIREVFVGLSDPIISQDIYLGTLGVLPQFPFNKADLENIEFWGAFYDRTILRVDDLLQDETLNDIYKEGELRKEIVISGDKWTDPIRIPRGLGVRMNFITEANFEFKIEDFSGNRRSSNVANRQQGGYFNVGALDSAYELPSMKKPFIYFKLVDNNAPPAEISLGFLRRLFSAFVNHICS